MYSFADVTDAAPETTSVDIADTSLVMPPQVAFWAVIPLIDLALGAYNLYVFEGTSSWSAMKVSTSIFAAIGVISLGAWT